jgi:tetratricopeptide (TPR) repeat protein
MGVRLGLVAALALGIGCSADYRAAKAKAALDSHDLAAAERHYRSALARDANHIGALSGLGWTYLLAGQTEAARGAFERCHEVAPTAPDCLRGSAAVASAAGNPAQARTLLNEALVVDPHNAGVQSSLALLDLTGGQLDDAGSRYAELVKRYPDQAEYRLGHAEVQLRKDRYDDALATIDAALAIEQTPQRYRAMLYQTQARTLVAATADRVDGARCGETAPQVRAWLDAAEEASVTAKGSGVPLPDLTVVRRLIRRRRAMVNEVCPPIE